jgi:monovalent cation/hydrogen antiporter
VLFLPPLLMASAYYTVWRDFRAAMVPILLLAVGAVAFTTFAVGFAAHLVAPALPYAVCFTLGAIVSPPDAVAAKAVLQRLSLPRRLVTILEGESLVNDASGLVLYRFSVVAALTGAFSAPQALGQFVWLAVGGIAIGLASGTLIIAIIRRLRQTDLVVALTLIFSWTIYIGAERLGASGVLAVVAAGILFGIRQHAHLDAGTRMQAGAVWEIVVYVLEALVFVLIGLALRGVLGHGGGAAVLAALPLALVTVGVVVVSRLVWVLAVTSAIARLVPERLRRQPAPTLLPTVVVGWAGMRGVVTLAIALALPETFPARDTLLLASFAVILFTVVVQGTTLGPLIRRLGVDRLPQPDGEPMNEAAARATVSRAMLAAIEAMVGADGPLHPQLASEYRVRVNATARLRDNPEDTHRRRVEHFAAALEATAAGRSELIRLHREGQIHDHVLNVLEEEFDLEELRLRRLGKLATEGHH